MQLSFAVVATYAGLVLAAPYIKGRQQDACFVTGDVELPQSVTNAALELQNTVTCDTGNPTISGAPDVETGGIKFSSINFEGSGQSPLAFALDRFATTEPLADNDLNKFQAELAVYIATEVALRSTGQNVAEIKVPKFFLEMQVSRIRVAQGETITDAGQQVDHLLGKVQKNAGREDQALLDQVTALAAQLS